MVWTRTSIGVPLAQLTFAEAALLAGVEIIIKNAAAGALQLGRMFRRMMDAHNLSQRSLATDVHHLAHAFLEPRVY